MGRIWVTGDIHGDPRRILSTWFADFDSTITKEDVVEVLGDFGLVWEQQESLKEKDYLDALDSMPFTTVATLGNHENYDRIATLPVEEHFGAPVWVLRPSVFLLQSGYVYTINNQKIWNFNGARSHDIKDGILDMNDPDYLAKGRALDEQGKYYWRVKGLSWWEQEIEQDYEVYERGRKNLATNDWRVDMIWTHCASNECSARMGFFGRDSLMDYLEEISQETKFKNWYFGHYHVNRTPVPHQHCLYDIVERVY